MNLIDSIQWAVIVWVVLFVLGFVLTATGYTDGLFAVLFLFLPQLSDLPQSVFTFLVMLGIGLAIP